MRAGIVAVAAATALSMGYLTYWRASSELIASAGEDLYSLMELRRDELGEYYDQVIEGTTFWARNRLLRPALPAFIAAWKQLGDNPEATLQRLYIEANPHPLGEKDKLEDAGDGSRYSAVHAEYHSFLKRFISHWGFYDIFLFDPAGNLVYSGFKEDDFATNLITGRWADSGLGEVFRGAHDDPSADNVVVNDFASYGPSHGAPAAFAASPVLDDDGKLVGVLAFQISIDRIDRIMQVVQGMGETGETYAVGEDMLMRSDSRFSSESTILKTRVETRTAKLALAGETGFEVTDDYRGIPVLSAYGPLDLAGMRWAVLAEVDEAEVLKPVRQLLAWLVFAGVVVVGATALIVGLFGRLISRNA